MTFAAEDAFGNIKHFRKEGSGSQADPMSDPPFLVTTYTDSQVAVTTASTSVLAANAARRHVLIVNDSASKVYLSLSGTAVLGRGIALYPNGGSYEISGIAGNMYRGVITAIGSAAAALCVTEGV